VNGKDVAELDVREIMTIMADCSDKERRLTIIPTRAIKTQRLGEEAKESHSP
jgi:hypothetical protein